MIPLSKIKRIVTSVMGKGISDIVPLKKGMTNDSYIFRHGDSRYVLRLNGVGTEKLINRKQESDTYRAIAGLSLSDTVIAIDEKQGYKITKFIENARTCNSMNTEDVSLCMEKLRAFHEKNIHTSYTFDLYRMLDYYQSLWIRKKSMYADYDEVKNRIYNWKPWIEKVNKEHWTLTHMDAVPDNFMITDKQEVVLIDWEYAGMQDKHFDLAMFAIYAGYTLEESERLMHIYFKGECSSELYIRILAYHAIGGLLWSNWCEFKEDMGIHFGEYAQKQYEYAKEYSLLVDTLLQELKTGGKL